MNIQSLSICVPAKRCINDCEFCCSKMHGGDYEDMFSNFATTNQYLEDLRIRMQYARDNGCNTLMLTGNNEPQQNKDFLRCLALINKSLRKPFYNIEMQTSGAFIDEDMLDFLKSCGVTTMAISVACIDNDDANRFLIHTPDSNLNISKLCGWIKERNMNLRICLNMTDHMVTNKDDRDVNYDIDYVVNKCIELKADQITCRKLWTSEDGTSQADWIKTNVTDWADKFVNNFARIVQAHGTYLDTLEYGAKRYDYKGFSVVVDVDSMSQDTEGKDAVKYLIIRPNGHMYSKWDSKASLIF